MPKSNDEESKLTPMFLLLALKKLTYYFTTCVVFLKFFLCWEQAKKKVKNVFKFKAPEQLHLTSSFYC